MHRDNLKAYGSIFYSNKFHKYDTINFINYKRLVCYFIRHHRSLTGQVKIMHKALHHRIKEKKVIHKVLRVKSSFYNLIMRRCRGGARTS